ncbi:MAG: NAD-dependent succinate-semialdehyde dehydrogenase [Gammaproteobacteria bacterium]
MLYIEGTWGEANSGKRFTVTNPATGEPLGDVADGDQSDVRRAIDAAHRALPAWSATTAYERSQLLYKAWERVQARAQELAKRMTEEQGKPLKAALGEIQYGADFLLWYAEEAKRLYGETIPSRNPKQRIMVMHQPVGVVGAVTPWNYPSSMVTRKLAPALAAGCTAVLKPADQTPFSAIELFKIFDEVGFPPGVVNLVTALDPKPIGEEFLTNPKVRKIAFTGSTTVGRQLAAGAAAQMKRVSLELGGHAPVIVFPDANVERAAKGLAGLKFLNAGQACISPNRIYVHRRVIEPFLETFLGRVSAMKVGNGLESDTRIGPLVDEAALDKVTLQVSDALDQGAKVLTGGKRLTENGLDRGCFYAPTVLTDVTPEMRIYREETFGPVAPIIPFDDQDDVVAMANDTDYGLAAYVFTENLARAMRVTEALQFGIVGVNDVNPSLAAAPFGGMKNSGLGREGGIEGIREYLETKTVGIGL